MREVLLIGLTTWFLCLTGCTPVVWTPEETNTSFEHAMEITLGSQVQGSLDSASISRWYKFTIQRMGILRIAVTQVPSNIDMDARLYNVNKQELANSVGTAIGVDVRTQSLETPGTYWLRLEDGNHDQSSRSNYTLCVAADDTPMVLGSAEHGQIDPVGDVDWFIVSTTLPGVLEIFVDSVPVNIDMDLHVIDEREQEIASSTGTGYGAGVYMALLEGSGTFFLRLEDGTAYGNSLQSSPYYYRLWATLDASDPYEINNDRSQARAIALETEVRAKIRPVGDCDWFTITTQQTGVVEVAIDSVPVNIDMDLHVYDEREREIANSTGTGYGASVRLPFLVGPGTYWLRLEDGTRYGNPLEASPYFYTLRASLDASDSHEINNSQPDARLIQVNSLVRAKICPTGDVDWFKFVPAQAESVRITIDSVPPNIDMDVYVYDYRYPNEVARSTGTGNGQSVSLPIYLSVPDTYYLRLEDGGANQSSSQYYELMVRE